MYTKLCLFSASFILHEFWERRCQFVRLSKDGVEDTRLEAKAKDTKKIQGQGQPSRGQTLSRPRIGMLEAKAKDQGQGPKQKINKRS